MIFFFCIKDNVLDELRTYDNGDHSDYMPYLRSSMDRRSMSWWPGSFTAQEAFDVSFLFWGEWGTFLSLIHTHYDVFRSFRDDFLTSNAFLFVTQKSGATILTNGYVHDYAPWSEFFLNFFFSQIYCKLFSYPLWADRSVQKSRVKMKIFL